MTAVAIAPALLSAPTLAVTIGGRMDRAGALLAGTIGAWFVLSLVRGASGAAQGAMLPLIVGAGIVSAIPMLPEVVRLALQRIGDVAFLVLAAVAASGAGGFDATRGAAALGLFVAIAGTAFVVAWLGGVAQASAFAGAGSRDPAVATAVALALGGGTAVPLYAGVLLFVVSAALAVLNRRKAR